MKNLKSSCNHTFIFLVFQDKPLELRVDSYVSSDYMITQSEYAPSHSSVSAVSPQTNQYCDGKSMLEDSAAQNGQTTHYIAQVTNHEPVSGFPYFLQY